MKKTEKCLITGAAGFIGYYLSKKLLEEGYDVLGLDNLNRYYDIELKLTRLELLKPYERFEFHQIDLTHKDKLDNLFRTEKPEIVVNLAAQAGVRYSIENPDAYIQSNVIGFYNILEACRHFPVSHLVYASSSSVYGANKKVPFEETDFVDTPVSLYAATKRTNELMAYTYCHLYGISSTALRFFTVYGPLGRPDMAYFSFINSFFKGKPIRIFNNGDLQNDLLRDFTYIDDIIEGIARLLEKLPTDDNKYKIYNIGNNHPEQLMVFIETLEKCLSKSLGKPVVFEKSFEPMKAGDVPVTFASTYRLQAAVDFKPSTPLAVGLQKFTDWYVKYYQKK